MPSSSRDSSDSTAAFWVCDYGESLKALQGHTFYISFAIVSPVCALVFTGS
jgi:hypothetical protein